MVFKADGLLFEFVVHERRRPHASCYLTVKGRPTTLCRCEYRVEEARSSMAHCRLSPALEAAGQPCMRAQGPDGTENEEEKGLQRDQAWPVCVPSLFHAHTPFGIKITSKVFWTWVLLVIMAGMLKKNGELHLCPLFK